MVRYHLLTIDVYDRAVRYYDSIQVSYTTQSVIGRMDALVDDMGEVKMKRETYRER